MPKMRIKKSGYFYAYYKALIDEGYTSKEAMEIASDYLPEEDEDLACEEENYMKEMFDEDGHRHYYQSEPDYQKKNMEAYRKARKK